MRKCAALVGATVTSFAAGRLLSRCEEKKDKQKADEKGEFLAVYLTDTSIAQANAFLVKR